MKNLERWIREHLFDVVPMSIAVIDRSFNIVLANKAFEEMFGAWEGKKCHAVYKKSASLCPHCAGAVAFEDGLPQLNEEVGFSSKGLPTRYVKQTIPVRDEKGEIAYLIEMSTDITEMDQVKRELRMLFDEVPCNISVLDRDLRIVRANRRILNKFGDVKGHFCYEVFKDLGERCGDCPAWRTFQDGLIHTGQSVVTNRKGEEIIFHVTTAPLEEVDDKVSLVLEMAVDITENVSLHKELAIAHSFLETLVAASVDGIIALDENDRVTIFNRAARKLFQVGESHTVTREELVRMLPKGFLDQVSTGPGHVFLPDTTVHTIVGEPIPARLIGVQMETGGRFLGLTISVQALFRLKELEKANLEAERLAAVGQTVAGLAHGVKNLIAGLEGGMYMLNTGINRSDGERIVQGWDILDRNIGRIATFVKAFLSFSRGRKISVALTDPATVAQEVVDLYTINAKKLGIELLCKSFGDIAPAPLDSEGIHESLTNLVGNAIDACQMSDGEGGKNVMVRVFEDGEAIVYEVADDGCGMDYEVKKKVFTNFFTSKGLGGTGIGLLQTRKIIQEHGGRIEVESEPGQGSTFRVILPRSRLPEPDETT